MRWSTSLEIGRDWAWKMGFENTALILSLIIISYIESLTLEYVKHLHAKGVMKEKVY